MRKLKPVKLVFKKCSIKNPLTREMSGFIGLGMEDEARQLARKYLEIERPNLKRFEAAMELLLREPSEFRDWIPLIEKNYAALNKRDQRLCRSHMIYFYGFLGDYIGVLRFTGKRFHDLFHLAFAFQGRLATGNIAEARRLALRLKQGAADARFPDTRRWLQFVLEENQIKLL